MGPSGAGPVKLNHPKTAKAKGQVELGRAALSGAGQGRVGLGRVAWGGVGLSRVEWAEWGWVVPGRGWACIGVQLHYSTK